MEVEERSRERVSKLGKFYSSRRKEISSLDEDGRSKPVSLKRKGISFHERWRKKETSFFEEKGISFLGEEGNQRIEGRSWIPKTMTSYGCLPRGISWERLNVVLRAASWWNDDVLIGGSPMGFKVMVALRHSPEDIKCDVKMGAASGSRSSSTRNIRMQVLLCPPMSYE